MGEVMFKSVFVKYISTFMLINIISIFFSTSIITTLVGVYDEQDKTRTLTNVTYAATDYMINDYTKSGEISFNDYLNNSVYDIMPVLKAMANDSDIIIIFIADGDGVVKLVGGARNDKYFGDEDGIVSTDKSYVYPESVVSELEEKRAVSRNDDLDGFFSEKHRSYIQAITTKDGKIVGSVMSVSLSSATDVLLEAMIKTIVMSTLWLMLATLVAVYFITERLVSPIRAMSKASKEFAAGHFDARVEVSGNDEVAELADAFNNMAGSLQHSEETRRLFLANVSHDLRTPMTTISGFIESILSGAIPQEKVPHYLEVIASEVKRLARLVSSLLDLTKIQAGERKFNKTAFDICEMARQIIISSEQRLEAKKLDVDFDTDKFNIYVSADRDSIYQVLYNICDNAIKFSREGGKYIVSIKEAGQKVLVSVYNEGVGIAPEDLPYVFDRFYKGDKSRGLDKTGTGLGLYISKTIMEAQNEKISVESEYGSWCRFTFTLQRTSAPKQSNIDRNGDNA